MNKKYKDNVVSCPENERATELYQHYQTAMNDIDVKVKNIVDTFCGDYLKYRKYADIWKYLLTVNHSDDNLVLCNNDGQLVSPYNFETVPTNQQLVNYGYFGELNAWFSATWNFSDCNNKSAALFCHDVLNKIKDTGMMTKEKGRIELIVNGIQDVHDIHAINVPIEKAYEMLIELYAEFARLLPEALERIADNDI